MYNVLSLKHFFFIKILPILPYFLEGLFGRNGNPALWLCGIMQKHHGAQADF